MKRKFMMMAGILSLSLAIYVSNTLWAQTGASKSAPVVQNKTKVALLNLTYVIKNYTKFKAYNDDLKKTVEPFQAKDTKLKQDAEKLAKEATDAKTTVERRDAIERQLKELQRRVEDNKNDAQKLVVKKQEDQLKTLYLDVRGVVEKYAQAHGFEMVLHYNDAVTPEEYWSPQNIARKIQAGALMPMYIANGLDISANIVSTLNQAYANGARTGSRP